MDRDPRYRLLSRLANAELADAIAGDLAEMRARHASQTGRVRATVWYWHAMAGIQGYLAWRRIAAIVRAGLRVWRPGGGRGEFRLASRSLRRSPWYAVTVVGVIAMSITLATTVFAVVDGVLFRPLPYPNAEEIFAVSGLFDDESEPPEQVVGMMSPREVAAWNEAVPDVPITLLGYTSIQLADDSSARAVMVDRDFLDVFGVRLLAGGFDDQDFDAAASPRPIIISHALWVAKFDSDPNIVGHTFSPPDAFPRTPEPMQVVGVLDENGFVPSLPGSPDTWIHRESRVDALLPNTLSPAFGERIGTAFTRVPPEGRRGLEAQLHQAAQAYGATAARAPATATRGQRLARNPYDRVVLEPLATVVTTRQRPVLSLVFATTLGLTLLVLLNAGALATARAQRRLPELAVRRALGARARDLLRSALAEQALLVTAGTIAGILMATSFLDVVGRQLPPGLTLIKDATIDWRAAAFALIVAATMTTTIALLNVRYAVRYAVPGMAAASRHGRNLAQARTGRWLVAGQIAIAFALVLGGVLFMTSLGLVWREDVGMRTNDAAIVGIRFDKFVATTAVSDVAAALRRHPGVTSAGALDIPLLTNSQRSSSFFSGPDGAPPDEPPPTLLRVGAGFFDAAAIALLEGRLPTDAELDTGAPVIAVSEALARRYWPSGGAVGRTLTAGTRPPHTVVGVVRDPRIVAWDVASNGMIFGSLALSRTVLGGYLFLALDADRPATLADITSHLTRAAPDARLFGFQRVDEALTDSIRPRQISALAAGAFALAALALVMLGLFGLVAQSAGWRMREMGVRLALGDTPVGIVWRVLIEPLGAVGAGIVAGGGLAFLAAGVVGSYLYGIAPYNAWIWVAAALALVATAALGAFIPALRAGRLNVVAALRDAEGV